MAGAAEGGHKLWGGRFAGGPSPLLEAINRSITVDIRLWPHDVRLSKAWAVALWNAGVLTLEESDALEYGLDRVAERLAAGEAPTAADEDIHTMIDRLLHQEIGTAEDPNTHLRTLPVPPSPAARNAPRARPDRRRRSPTAPSGARRPCR